MNKEKKRNKKKFYKNDYFVVWETDRSLDAPCKIRLKKAKMKKWATFVPFSKQNESIRIKRIRISKTESKFKLIRKL